MSVRHRNAAAAFEDDETPQDQQEDLRGENETGPDNTMQDVAMVAGVVGVVAIAIAVPTLIGLAAADVV